MTLLIAEREPRAPDVRKTRAEELRAQLADDIVRGALAPGRTLDEMELARRFGVSRTPVREAIRQLAASGLVETRPHRGAVVARPNHQRILGMFGDGGPRCAPELAAKRERRRTTRLRGRARGAARADSGGDPQRYHEVNEQFHATIYAGAHNGYLADMTLATRTRVQPFRRAQFRLIGRLAKSHVEHDRVVLAILRGDKAGAASAMRAHILTVGEEYEAYVESL